jgi:hypothetical protein
METADGTYVRAPFVKAFHNQDTVPVSRRSLNVCRPPPVVGTTGAIAPPSAQISAQASRDTPEGFFGFAFVRAAEAEEEEEDEEEDEEAEETPTCPFICVNPNMSVTSLIVVGLVKQSSKKVVVASSFGLKKWFQGSSSRCSWSRIAGDNGRRTLVI